MFAAMAILLSSIASRLRLRRRNKRITSSSGNPRPPFFSCGGGGDTLSPFVKPKTTRKLKAPSSTRFAEHGQDGGTVDDDDVGEPCLWRRTILLGQRCQPLEFSGAIHYDNDGRRLWHARTPLLSPGRSSEFGYIDRA
ncbi:hypothetical protein CFC21_047372 [Triticum aestivum]|uniref:Uncharacterized protein n=3 Tax=Triticinae TaxID=1648030 RepID=A0A453F4K1_AEGTS|nr:uncharacterized protein LOC109740153 [Aegilops tauschii subsp. strangulata]XP_044357178.1 uncharacterized protein LOC123078658 [Triticum aestivum]KAF7036845.1 hypothetical protein CFC21_047372 [Triticum aestivum]